MTLAVGGTLNTNTTIKKCWFLQLKFTKHVRIANREDSDQTASSDLGLCHLSKSFWQATHVQNLRTF